MIIYYLFFLRLIFRFCFLVLVDKFCEDKILKLNSIFDNFIIKYYDEMSSCIFMIDLVCINAFLSWVCIFCGGFMVVNKILGIFRFL